MFRSRRKKLIFEIIFILIIFLWILKSFSSFDEINLSTICLKLNKQPKSKIDSNLILISELNLFYCNVPKAASTNLRRLIISYLNSNKSFQTINRKQVWFDYEKFFSKYYFNQSSPEILRNLPDHIFKFVLVRHPFRRILSVYNDKFLNNHLEDTLSGWIQLEENILLEMKTNETLISIRRNEIRLDFQTFLLYIIDSIQRKNQINSHWERIVQRCFICSINYNWIGKIENFDEDSKILIEKLNNHINRINLEFPSKNLDRNLNKSISLTDYQLFQYFRSIIRDDEKFRILIDYYRPDLQIFKYLFPKYI